MIYLKSETGDICQMNVVELRVEKFMLIPDIKQEDGLSSRVCEFE